MTNLPQITTVPTVWAAVVAAFRGIASDPAYGTLEVNYGPAFSSSAHNMIAVGVGNPGVEHQFIRQNRGVAYDEAYDIRCLQWAWSGSRDMQQHVLRCETVLAAIRDAIDAINIDRVAARLGDAAPWIPAVSGEGASCSQEFSVHVAASL